MEDLHYAQQQCTGRTSTIVSVNFLRKAIFRLSLGQTDRSGQTVHQSFCPDSLCCYSWDSFLTRGASSATPIPEHSMSALQAAHLMETALRLKAFSKVVRNWCLADQKCADTSSNGLSKVLFLIYFQVSQSCSFCYFLVIFSRVCPGNRRWRTGAIAIERRRSAARRR